MEKMPNPATNQAHQKDDVDYSQNAPIKPAKKTVKMAVLEALQNGEKLTSNDALIRFGKPIKCGNP